MTEAILIIVALGGLEFTLWMLGRRHQTRQLQVLESIHFQLLLRSNPRPQAARPHGSPVTTFTTAPAPLEVA